MSKAKEIFEELGYKVKEETPRYLRYLNRTISEDYVDFDKKNKLFRIRSRSGQGNTFANYVDYKLAKAIAKQCEELFGEEV